MHCNEVREMLLEGKVTEEIRQHNRNCEECAALGNTAKGLKDFANSWREQSVPTWNRVPEELRSRRGPSLWLVWAPLAACLLMCFLVVSRAQVSWDKNGFQLAFGQVQPVVDQAYVTQAMNQLQNSTKQDMTALLKGFQQNQQAYVSKVINDLAEESRKERKQDLRSVANSWQNQREEDLKTLERQINLLINRQNRNADNLYQLASFVKRRD